MGKGRREQIKPHDLLKRKKCNEAEKGRKEKDEENDCVIEIQIK